MLLKTLSLLRRLLLCAGLFMVPLTFWLPAHEVFEQPKTVVFLVYTLALAAASLPLLPRPLPRRKRAWLWPALGLALAVGLSILNGWRLLPADPWISLEHAAPLWACAFTALVLVVEDDTVFSRALWCMAVTACLVAFYGLIQFLDQTLGRSLGIPLDLVRWTSFGVTRIYSTMGNPDYMAALFSMLIPLFAGMGRRNLLLDFRSAMTTAALALLAIPALLLLATGYTSGLHAYVAWALFCLVLLALIRLLKPAQCWLALLALLALLILAAQGRGAYLALAVAVGGFLLGLWKFGGREVFRRHRGLFLGGVSASAGLVLGLALLVAARAACPDLGLLRVVPFRSGLRLADSLAGRLETAGNPLNDANVVRLFYYRAALQLFRRHPLLGVGYGNNALYTAGAQSVIWKRWQAAGNPRAGLVEPHVELYTHNDLLQNLAESGLLGTLAYLFFWGFFFRRGWKILARDGLKAAGLPVLGLMAMGAAFWTNSLLNFPWRVLASLQLCWFGYALMARLEDWSLRSASGPTAAPGWGWGRPQAAPAEPAAAPRWLLPATLATALLALLAASIPARWFTASLLMKKGDQYREANQAAPSLAFYEKADQVGVSGTQAVEEYLYLGSMENVAGHPDKAIQYFNQGVRIYPDFIEAHYNLGYTYLGLYQADPRANLADRDLALGEFNRVLDIDPRYTNALNNLGNLYFDMRQLDKASQAYRTLLRYQDNLYQAHYNLAAVYLLQGDKAGAESEFSKCLEDNPSYAPARAWLAKLKAMPRGAALHFH